MADTAHREPTAAGAHVDGKRADVMFKGSAAKLDNDDDDDD